MNSWCHVVTVTAGRREPWISLNSYSVNLPLSLSFRMCKYFTCVGHLPYKVLHQTVQQRTCSFVLCWLVWGFFWGLLSTASFFIYFFISKAVLICSADNPQRLVYMSDTQATPQALWCQCLCSLPMAFAHTSNSTPATVVQRSKWTMICNLTVTILALSHSLSNSPDCNVHGDDACILDFSFPHSYHLSSFSLP